MNKRGWELPIKRGCSHPLAHFKTEAELAELFCFVAAHPHMPLRQIAQHFRCSHMCVYRVLKRWTYNPPT